MTVSINNQPVNCEIQSEKTIRDVLEILEEELRDAGQTITGITVNGIDDNNGVRFDELCEVQVSNTTVLDVSTKSMINLFAFAVEKYIQSIATGNSEAIERWKQYIASYDEKTASELHNIETHQSERLEAYTEALISLLSDPVSALKCVIDAIEAIIPDMQNIAVLFQTGKDSEVMSILTRFSDISDTFVRVFRILKLAGKQYYPLTINEIPVEEFISGYNTVLKDFLLSLSGNDTVLTGDLSEYEIVPRLESICRAFSLFR